MTVEEQKAHQEQMEKTFTEVLSKNMQGVEKNLETIIEEKFKKTVKELNLDKLDLKHGMFPGVAGADNEKVAKAERFNKFIKFVFAKDTKGFAEQYYGKTLSGDVDSEGGFLVPTEFVGEIQRIAQAYGLVRKYATVVPMASDKMSLPAGAGSVQTYWQGVQNAVAALPSNPLFKQINLIADTLTGISIIPNQLLKDAKINVMDYLLTLFAEAFAKEEDYQGLRGTGSPFVGVLNKTGVNFVTLASGTAFTDATLDDLLDLQIVLPALGRVGGAYFMNTQMWGHFQKIKENNQHIVMFQNNIMNMGDLMNYTMLTPVGSIMNVPVILTDTMPSLAESAAATPFIALGSMKKGLMLGDRDQVTTDISQEATINGQSTFERLQSAVRVSERIAIEVNLPEVWAVLRTHA